MPRCRRSQRRVPRPRSARCGRNSKEWKRVYAWCETPGITDDERNVRVEGLCKLELALYAEPSRDSDDLGLKMAVLSANDFSLGVDGDDAAALRLDVRRFFAERGHRLPGGHSATLTDAPR